MKNITETLRLKEAELLRLQEEIKVLRQAAAILADGNEAAAPALSPAASVPGSGSYSSSDLNAPPRPEPSAYPGGNPIAAAVTGGSDPSKAAPKRSWP